MHVFITGANGFVGLNIVQALNSEGHRVRAYVRNTSNVEHLSKFRPQIARGELSDRETLIRAMRGCDAVIHTAGNTSCRPRDYPTLCEVNVEGTRAVLDAAAECSIKRFVYTSTTSTIGAENNPVAVADESTRLTGFRARNPYGMSKLAAEEIVLQSARRGIDSVILNPAEIIGPFDHNFQWGRMVLAVYFNQVPFIPRGGASFCSAREVGKAHVAALTRGTPGKRYILGGFDCDYVKLLAVISRLTGKTYDRRPGNFWRTYTKALMQQWLKIGQPIVEPYRMRVFDGHYYFSSGSAVRDLAYREVSLGEMVSDCVNWYRDNGILPA